MDYKAWTHQCWPSSKNFDLLCADSGCCQEDLLRVIANRNELFESRESCLYDFDEIEICMNVQVLKDWVSVLDPFIVYLSTCDVVYSYADSCRTQRRWATQSFRKIYLSLYLKGLCVRGSWRLNRTATYWPSLLWPSASLSHSPGLLNRRLTLLGAGFLYCILSPTGLVSKLTDFLSSPSYIIVQSPT